MFFLLYRQHKLEEFSNFPKISEHFPKISEKVWKLSEDRPKVIRTFPNIFEIFRRLPNIPEDYRRISEHVSIIYQRSLAPTTLKMVKHASGYDVIDILTSEDMENTPLGTRM